MMKLWTKDGYFPQVFKETLASGKVVHVARHPFLPGVTAQADTEELAAEQWHEMREAVFGDLVEMGQAIPQPWLFRFDYKPVTQVDRLIVKTDLIFA